MLIGKDFDINGRIVKNNETYIVKDDCSLKTMVTSYTDLNPGMCTGGHSHEGQEEIYIFTSGYGRIQIDDCYYFAAEGDTFAIPDGAFHKVYNDSLEENFKFIAIFAGDRNHK